MDALELTNSLRAEAVRVSESGLPLRVFPQRVQEIIFNFAAYEDFNIEFICILDGCRHIFIMLGMK